MNSAAFKSILASAVVAMSASQAFAQEALVDQAWEGHKKSEHCYAVSFPVKERQGGSSYITVTSVPDKKIKDELALSSGFDPEANIEGSFRVDNNQPFRLLVHRGVGFINSLSVERDAVKQMRAGKELQVKWTKANGEYVVDKYSLFGFSKANNFAKSCK